MLFEALYCQFFSQYRPIVFLCCYCVVRSGLSGAWDFGARFIEPREVEPLVSKPLYNTYFVNFILVCVLVIGQTSIHDNLFL